MPTYSKGVKRRRTNYSTFFSALGIYTEYSECIWEFESDNPFSPSGYKPVSLVKRSRGRHDPGSGNYWCCRAIAPVVMTVSGQYTYLHSYGPVYHTVATAGGTEHYEYFDGYNRYIITHAAKNSEANRYTYTFKHRDSEYRCVFDIEYATCPCDAGYLGAAGLAGLDFKTVTISRDALASVGGDYQITGSTTADCTIEMPYDLIEGTNLDLIPDYILNSVYVKAFESLPKLTMNNIANVADILSTCKSLFFEPYKSLGSLASTAKDAWLGYRYMFSTTKSDINDAANYLSRISSLRDIPDITGRGTLFFDKKGRHYEVRCSVTCSMSDLRSIGSWAERFGLALNAYNLWDMIPYSFIVDWFLPIGDLIETMEARNSSLQLSPSVIWYSITREYTNAYDCHQVDYVRWSANKPPTGLPTLIIDGLSTNEVTWIKRGADVLALSH